MNRQGYIIVTVDLFEEEGQYVGRCRELGTAACGDTFDEANEALIEAIDLQLDALEQVGERERFFRENGIKLYPTRPALKTLKERRVSLPVDGFSGQKLVPVHC
jgi:predicted RNase H-like HicB family nuclease